MDVTNQIIPNTIAARKPKDRSAASTFSLVESSIVASNPANTCRGSVNAGRDPRWVKKLGRLMRTCQGKKLLRREVAGFPPRTIKATGPAQLSVPQQS
jgi:hypothetical protein